MKIQFIGIGGVGVSALAKMYLNYGHEISGVNNVESPQTLAELQGRGVEIKIGTSPELLDESADLYVYSSAWWQIAPSLMQKVKESGKAKSYFEALGDFSKNFKTIAVSGTHGKSTTTAMLHDILSAHSFAHETIVGTILAKEKSNYAPAEGGAEHLLVEACEYKRHFLFFEPDYLAISNIEAEHLDYYKDLEDVKDAFLQMIKQTKKAVILNMKDESLKELAERSRREIEFVDYGAFLADVPSLKVPGEHNKKNAALALASAAAILKSDFELARAKRALESFAGSWRRFEVLGKLQSGVTAVSDYAHHPSEIKASLQAAKEYMQEKDLNGRLIAIFEPHTYSRAKALASEFAESFGKADKVYVLPIYAAREEEIPGVNNEFLAERINAVSKNAEAKTFFDIKPELEKESGTGDLIIGLGAGRIDQDLRGVIVR